MLKLSFNYSIRPACEKTSMSRMGGK